MPADYIAVRDSCYSRKKKSKKRPLTKAEKASCKTMAVKWWVKKHGKPFPGHGSTDISEKDIRELQSYILDDSFWNDNMVGGSVWGQLTDKDNSYDAVESIMLKAGVSEDFIRIRQEDPFKYKKFYIKTVAKGIKSIVGVSKKDSNHEIQSYLFEKKNQTIKDSVKWIKEHNKLVIAEDIDWAADEEIAEAFEHQLEYDLICKAKILDVNNLDKESLAAAGIKNLDKDLMAVEFKLVHANTNTNKDTFLKEELKSASATPKFKPINWQHTDRIIGVMSDSKYVEVSSEANESPEDDHIIASGVIYKYKFPTYAAEMLKRHDDDELYFSMETWFDEAECSVCSGRFQKKADYCDHLKTRMAPESTASRVLRGLVFSGTGVVENPADEQADSISIGSDQSIDNTKEDTDMPKKEDGQIVFETEKELNDFVAEKVSKAIEAEKEKTGTEQLAKDLEKANKEKDELQKKLDKKDEEIQTKEDEKASVQTEFDNFKDNIEKDKRAQERFEELEKAGAKFPEGEKGEKIRSSIKKMDDNEYASYKEVLSESIPTPDVKPNEEKPSGDTKADDDKPQVDAPAVKPEDQDSKNLALKTILDKTTSYEKEDDKEN